MSADTPDRPLEKPWRATRSVSGLTLISVVGAVVGALSNALIAFHFGAGRLTDAFFLAQSIPLVFAQLLQSGPLPSVFLPIFIRARQEEGQPSWRLLNNLITLLLILNAVLIVVGFIFAPLLVRAIGIGFDAERAALGTRVLRFLIFALISQTLSGVLMIALNSLNLFVLPALLSLLPATGVIVMVALFASSWGIDAWIWGNLVGPAAFLLGLGLVLRSQGFRYRFVLDLRQPELREVIRQASRFFISSAFTQGQILSTKFVASLLAPGSLSALAYAERIFLAASSLFILPLPSVIFPELVRRQVADRLGDLRQLLFKASRALVLQLTPLTIGMMVTSGWVVGLLLQRGLFDAQDSSKTTWALTLYFMAFLPLGYKMLFTNSLYALQRTRVVVLALCAGQAAIIVGNFTLPWLFDFAGVALAHVIGQFVLVAVQTHYLRREFSLEGVFLNASTKKSLLAGATMGVIGALLIVWLPPVASASLGMRGAGLLGLVAILALIYTVLVLGFRIPEAQQLWAAIRVRLGGRSS